jgi:hypothetical protein
LALCPKIQGNGHIQKKQDSKKNIQKGIHCLHAAVSLSRHKEYKDSYDNRGAPMYPGIGVVHTETVHISHR